MKAVPIPSTKSITFCNIDIFYWNVSNKVAAIPPQCQRCCWLPVSWGRIAVSCHLLSLSGAQSSSFCGLTPKEHIDKPSFSHQQIQYFWNLFYWCTYTAAHLSASADLLLQFGEFLLVHTEFLHLKSKHKRWKFTHIWLNIFKTAQTSIQYSTNLAILNTAPGLTANYPQIQKGTYLMAKNTLTFSHGPVWNLQILFCFFAWHIELTRMHSCQKPQNSSTVFSLSKHLDYKETINCQYQTIPLKTLL